MATAVEELEGRLGEIRSEIRDIDAEHAGQMLPEAAKARWRELNEEREQVEATIEELKVRAATVEHLATSEDNTEREISLAPRGKRVASHIPDDPTRFEDYRTMARSIDDLDQAYRDGANKLLDRSSFHVSHPSVSKEEAQNDIERLVRIDNEVAQRVIFTSTAGYKREFEQYCKMGTVGPELMRAGSLTTTAGGYAVPVELDTTLLLTNSGVVNPIRNLARVRQTNVNTVEFINTTGITASYGAEATEASDGAPTLAQPVVNIEKAQAFVPFSIEIGEDWAAIQEDMALAFADARNQLEAQQFLTGLGHSSHAPQGLIAVGGATAIVSTATTAVFAVADLYSLENALSPRYRPNASFVANRAAYQKIRQFDTAGGASLWIQLQNANPPTLLGYNAYEWSNYSSGVTTSGSTIMTLGDFNYFAIVDRAGMNVEYVPLLFGSSNRYPTGQRGLYLWWRNSSQVLSPTLQANSAFVSLKVL